jgi:hypothetical protein
MAAAAAARADPEICEEKLRLAHAFLQTLRAVMHLQNEEAAVLVLGAPGLERFGMAIQRARERREEAKLAYMLHIASHSC